MSGCGLPENIVPRSISCVPHLLIHATVIGYITFRVSCRVHGSKGETPVRNSRCASMVAGARKLGNTLRM